MKIDPHTRQLSFNVKLPGDTDWTLVSIPLRHLKRENFTCDESLAIELKEYIYAADDRFYEQEEDLVFEDNNYWNNIVVPVHQALYPDKALG